MATSFVSPVSGREDTNVIPKTGGIAFDLPLYELETTGGISYTLTLGYKSALLKEEYGTWTPEAPENLIAVGWALNIGSRVFIIQKLPVKYGLYFNSVFYQLKEGITAGNLIHYSTVAHSLLHIYYDTAKHEWSVFAEDGTQYLFGRNDNFTNEHGTYAPETGTYAQASSEYNGIRDLISNPNAQGIPDKVSADNTICNTKEHTLFGVNNWVGPTNDIGAMNEQPSAWLLSHIIDSFDNTISFSYVQHISNLLDVQTSKTYSVASYLYRISVYCKTVLTEMVTFEYGDKDNSEYSVDFIATPRPNGCQQKFEKLFIKKLVHHSIKFDAFQQPPTLWIIDQIQFSTKLIKPTYNIVKRQLLEVQFLAKDTADIQISPSYQMTYYGSGDGVSVGASGFNDTDHLYFNAKTGALFGALKTITYPSGEMREYKYLEQDISSVYTSFYSIIPNSEPPTVITTPFGYTILFCKIPFTALVRFCVYTEKITGLHEDFLCSCELVENYDYERQVSYSEHIIGIIAPYRDDIYNLSIFCKDPENDKWMHKRDEMMGGDPDKYHVSVSDHGFAYTYGTLTDDRGQLSYVTTDDYGKTFHAPMNLTLEKVIDDSLDYRVITKVLEDKCLIFVMNRRKIMAPLPPDFWSTTSKTISTYYLKITGIRADGSNIKISDLGLGKILKHQYIPPYVSETDYGAGYVLTGGRVEQVVGIDLIGNFFVLRFKTKGFSIWYRKGRYPSVHDYTAQNISDWSVVLFHDKNMEEFSHWNQTMQTEALERVFTVPTSSYISTNPMVDSSVKVTENGIIYTVHYSQDKSPELENYTTSFCTYLGGSLHDFKLQKYDNKDFMVCLSKDNMFAIFQGKTKSNIYEKKYMYYNPANAVWAPILTGTVSSPSATHNESAEAGLYALFIVGIILSIALLPFGLSSAAGIICTSVSVGLFIAAEATSAVLQNSFKSSLNLEASYFGNRFINDGTTIWFRTQQQDRLTSIGSGTSGQPHDTLGGSAVTGTVLSGKQQFGHLYNYVPFFTDQKKLYYRILKNDAVGLPIPLGGASIGISDLFLNPINNNIYAYKDNYCYEFISGILIHKTSLAESSHPFNRIDACCMVMNHNNTEFAKIYISGQSISLQLNDERYHPPGLLKDIFSGSRFHYVDCALVRKTNTNNDEEFFYLFSNRDYELVKYTFSTLKFQVTERGTLDQYLRSRNISDYPFDKIDAAYEDQGTIFIRNNRFVKYSANGVLITEGRLGEQLLKEDMDIDDIELTYSYNILIYYKKASWDLQIQYLAGGNINLGLKSYMVDTVSFHDDPRFGSGVPSSVTKYKYLTDHSTLVRSTGTAVFHEVDICTLEDAL